MATKKQLTNRFQSDIDMCNNQIINYSSEYWGDKTEHDHLPDEAHGDVVFEGKHIYLLREYRITLSDGTTYIYQAGSECICHKDPTTGKFYWQKQLSSAISEDLSGAIKQLWKEKSGVIHVYATKAEMEGHKLDAWEMDLAIVDKDESQRTFDWEPAPRTLYIADGDGGEKTTVCKNWRLVCRIADNDRFRLVDEAKETGGKACFAPFHMEPDFSDPEGITVTVDKVRLNNNGPGRVDSIDIPVPKAYVRDDNPLTRTSTAGLYTKALAAEKVDRECTIDEGKSVISNLPSDKGACMVFETKDGIKSGVSVDINARAQIYAANQATGIGTRIDINESGAYYLGPMDGTRDPRDSDEIATLGDIKTIASKCWGTKNTYAELASITGMDVADYVYVLHDEDQLAKRSGETIAPSTRYYFGEDRAWHYACDIGNTSVRLLGDVPDAPAGTQFNLPYYFYTVENTDDIDAHVKSVSLDNKKTIGDYSLKIKGAHVVDTDPSKIKAGLYNKTLADKKVNVSDNKFVGEVKYKNKDADKIVFETPRRKLDLDQTAETPAPTFEIPKMDGTNAGLYTKAMADAKTDRKTTLANGAISEVDNVPGQQGAMMGIDESGTTYANKIKAAVAVNSDGDGVAEIKAQIYAKNVNDNKGSRLNITQQGIYYTVGRTDATFDANDDEIATKKFVKDWAADFYKNVEKHADIANITSTGNKPDINDYITVNDDTYEEGGVTKHNKQCWRYRYNGGSLPSMSSWEAECMISNVPFTPEQWITIDSKAYNKAAGQTAITGGVDISNLTTREIVNGSNKSLIFNESDGGGAKYENADGTWSYVGVNNGGQNGITAQIYSGKITDGKLTGSRLNVKTDGMYYTKGKDTSAVTANDEIAVIGDVKKKVDASVEYDSHKSQIINSAGNEGATLYGRTSDGRQVGITTNLTTGTDDILAQIYAKDSANKGARLAFTKKGAFYTNGKTEGSFTATDEIVVKSDLTSKMDKLPLETYSHTEYKFPFHIEAPVQNQTNITARFHTLILNDGVTRNQYDIAIPAADITNDKAGLYTKALADGKFDVPYGIPQNNDLIRWDAAQNKWVTWSMGSVVLTQAPMTGDGIRALTTMQDGWFVNCTDDETSPPVGGTQFLAGNWYLYTVNPTAGWNHVGMTLDLSPYQTRIVGSTDVDKDKILTTNNDGRITSSTVAADWLGRLAHVDVTSSIATALNGKVPKPATALTSATKCKITFDTNGLVTAGANLVIGDLPSLTTEKTTLLTGYTIATAEADLATTDSLNGALGKLQYAVKQRAKGTGTVGSATQPVYLSGGKIVAGTSVIANKLTGYAIASTASAIATTDTILQAFAKLEKRIKTLEDANLVRYG